MVDDGWLTRNTKLHKIELSEQIMLFRPKNKLMFFGQIRVHSLRLIRKSLVIWATYTDTNAVLDRTVRNFNPGPEVTDR